MSKRNIFFAHACIILKKKKKHDGNLHRYRPLSPGSLGLLLFAMSVFVLKAAFALSGLNAQSHSRKWTQYNDLL